MAFLHLEGDIIARFLLGLAMRMLGRLWWMNRGGGGKACEKDILLYELGRLNLLFFFSSKHGNLN